MTIAYAWRGTFDSSEVNGLHADAFEHEMYDKAAWDWWALVGSHSLGWVTARQSGALVGFVNIPWDGFIHAWIQDVMVLTTHRNLGIGTELVSRATAHVRNAGCEWLHVDFDDDLAPFYIDACGFKSSQAGLISLV